METTKLVAVELEVDEEYSQVYPAGFKYVHFQDQTTGKWYKPKPGFEVHGENVLDLFDEIEAVESHDGRGKA